MIHRSIDDQTLALAGLFQSVGLVRDVAHEGKADSAAFQTCVRSIFETSPATTAAVYGGVRPQRHLSHPDVANKVRTLLLAAIRSAVLWRQCGGNRWQLIFGRRKIIDTARALLGEQTG